MFIEEHPFESSNYIQTSSGNIVSRKATIARPQGLEIPAGKVYVADNVHIRSDLASVQLQKYVYIDEGAIIQPNSTITEPVKYIPISIGANTYIGNGSIVEAACIGIGCEIGKKCVLRARCILKDYVKVLDDAVILPDMVLPPFAIVAGSPAKIIGFRPESAVALAGIEATGRYESLVPIKI